jgi:hypothetical protein
VGELRSRQSVHGPASAATRLTAAVRPACLSRASNGTNSVASSSIPAINLALRVCARAVRLTAAQATRAQACSGPPQQTASLRAGGRRETLRRACHARAGRCAWLRAAPLPLDGRCARRPPVALGQEAPTDANRRRRVGQEAFVKTNTFLGWYYTARTLHREWFRPLQAAT